MKVMYLVEGYTTDPHSDKPNLLAAIATKESAETGLVELQEDNPDYTWRITEIELQD